MKLFIHIKLVGPCPSRGALVNRVGLLSQGPRASGTECQFKFAFCIAMATAWLAAMESNCPDPVPHLSLTSSKTSLAMKIPYFLVAMVAYKLPWKQMS